MNQSLELRVDDLPSVHRFLRLAVVTETYPPEVNGVSLSVARLVEEMRARNHSVQLVRLKQRDPEDGSGRQQSDDVLLRGMPIPRYPHLKMGVPSTRALAELWTRQRPDIVHIATEGPLGWSALRAARRLKLPVVSEFRTNFHAYSLHYGLGWLHKPILAYLRKFHNQTQRTLVPTLTLKAELERLRFERVSVMARGVDTELFSPAHRDPELRAAWGATRNTVIMLCVGRIAVEKNLGLLHDAWQEALRRGLKVHLIVVGDGPIRSELERQWPGVQFTGLQRGHELARIYASADLFVFPSLTETYGNVVPEAMASGLPVVAFDCAAASQLIRSGCDGYLAACDNPAQFVEQVCLAAASAQSRSAMGNHARARAQDQGWDRIISDLEHVMLDLLESPGTSPEPLEWRPVMN